MSIAASVSAATSGSLVWMNTRVPSEEAARNTAGKAPVPRVGPVETRSVTLGLAYAGTAAASDTAKAARSARIARFMLVFPLPRAKGSGRHAFTPATRDVRVERYRTPAGACEL